MDAANSKEDHSISSRKGTKRRINEGTPENPPRKLGLNKTSNHFTRSPSSPFGSVQSLGPLIEILSGYMKCYCFRCSINRKSLRFEEKKAAILSHFEACPRFMSDFKNLAKHHHHDIKEFEAIISSSVSHLCEKNCFLRAFASARKWHELRTTICHFGNISPDKVLQGWTCYLERDTAGTLNTGPKPRVSFVAPNGRKLGNGDLVLKSLGFIGCSTQRLNAKGATQERKETLHPPLRILQFRDRSFIESEIIGRTPVYGIECKIGDRPNCNGVRRTLQNFNGKEPDEDAVPATEITHGRLPILRCDMSPFGLIEELFQNNPWRLLISTILLNRTYREQVDFIMHRLLDKYGDSKSMESAQSNIISDIIRPIGIRYRRAETLIRFSREYNCLIVRNNDPFKLTYDDIMGLYGCGEYAAQAYIIFIRKEYDNISVSDHALQYYVDYKRGLYTYSKPSVSSQPRDPSIK